MAKIARYLRFHRKIMQTAAGVLALPWLLVITPSSAQATPHVRILWGVNRNFWQAFKSKVPLAQAVRVYYDTENVFPATWPDSAGKGVWVTLSIRPNPSDLLSGKLDARLSALLNSAPAHSELTIWHENYPGDPLGYPRSVNNARTAVAMQEYMERLCKGTRVRFGVIISGPASNELAWIAPKLDWYGVDLYDNKRYWNRDRTLSKEKIWARMTNNLIAFKKASGERHPMLRLDETNTPWDNHRRHWFLWVAQWFGTHDANRPVRILTYWNPKHGHASGGLSGPWPPSAPVVHILRLLSEAFR